MGTRRTDTTPAAVRAASATTTVRVRASTRDELNRLSEERGSPVEAIISEGLALLRREERRRLAQAEAAVAAGDPADRTEVAAALRDLHG